MTTARQAVDQVLKDLADVRQTVAPFPSCVVGSAVLAAYHEDLGTQGIITHFNDIDVFTSSESYFMLMGALMHRGYTVLEGYERTPARHLSRGFGGWKTNSLKLRHGALGFELNIICKYEGREECDDLYSVLLSFDWSGLAMGYDEFGKFHDMREALHPGSVYMPHTMVNGKMTYIKDENPTLGMLPARAATIGRGYMGEYIAARMFGRLAKLAGRGHNMDEFAKQIVNGYKVLSAHYQGFPDAKHQALASFYHDVTKLIEDKEWTKLLEASNNLIGLGDGNDDQAQFAADIAGLI